MNDLNQKFASSTNNWYIWLKAFMSKAKNTSITLGEHFESIINKSIASGRYASVSEVVRAGLRLLEKEEHKVDLLRNAIEEGEASGYVKDFDPNEHLAALNRKHAK